MKKKPIILHLRIFTQLLILFAGFNCQTLSSQNTFQRTIGTTGNENGVGVIQVANGNLVVLCKVSEQSSTNKVLSFNGTTDYVDLGVLAGNQIRTIELWFKPAERIDGSIPDFIGLVARNNGTTVNQHEFDISFRPIYPNNGKLEFRIEDANGNPHQIFSDMNTWNASQWYHVAGVSDTANGMMLFVDGVKQSDVDSYNLPTGSINKITSVGRWGDQDIRHFKGCIDEVRFSSETVYTANFEPPCQDLHVTGSTIGLWNFNENSGNTAFDMTSNSFNGTIHGASREQASLCNDYNDFALLLLDSEGSIISAKRFYITGNQEPIDILKTMDNGFIIVGDHYTASGRQNFIVKLDQDLEMVWTKLVSFDQDIAFPLVREDQFGNIYFGTDCKNGLYYDFI